MFFRHPILITKLFRELIWNFPDLKDKIYLTFDDGPTPEITPWVLDVLKGFKTKATFFCLGKNVEKYPDLFERIIKEGHTVGNHTYSHLDGWKTKNNEYFKDIELADKSINSKLFRPPFGRIRPSQIKYLKKKYKIIMWDVLCQDFNQKISKESCLQKVLKQKKGGSIIVFHDTIKAGKNLYYLLPGMLDGIKKKSFGFGMIE